jgi:GDP-mannose 6-dehydrogenase
MKISVFGLGYVGSVTAACLAERGHNIVGVDVNLDKVSTVNEGKAPIIEVGLDDLLRIAHADNRLSASTNSGDAVANTEVSIVCVGTPSLESGGLDLRFIRQVCQQIAEALEQKDEPHLLLLRSTMLPGSTRTIVDAYFHNHVRSGRLTVAYCPEFLREGSAVDDFRNPSLSVFGSSDGQLLVSCEDLVGKSQWLPWEGAEMVKYACNYWHALKVSFANEIGSLAHTAGVDGRLLMSTLCSDQVLNLSPYYMRPGNPFGGSCLPKDVSALCSFATEKGVVLPILDSVLHSNNAHANRLKQMVDRAGIGSILILGLSFKKDTDDIRNSPMVALSEQLLSDGRDVRIFDPVINQLELVGANIAQLSRRIPHLDTILVTDLATAFAGATTVVISHAVISIEDIQQHIMPTATVIDVNGWPALESLPCSYKGFCW